MARLCKMHKLRFTTVACIFGPARPSPDFTQRVQQSKPMAILNILEFPDPRLRTIAKPVAVVDDEVRQLVDDMFETMYEAPGIGLAATQVNVHKRIVVMDLSEDRTEPRVFINPEFESLTDEMDQYQEGCLSVPGFYENVDRPQRSKSRRWTATASPMS